jgi:hypothetical protein
MQIYIKTPRNTISLQVDPTYSISKVKKILYEREGIPISEQRLIFSGKQLEDKKTVAYYTIKGESTLHLMRRLRGGAVGLGVVFTSISATIASNGIITVIGIGTYTFGPPTVNSFILFQRDTTNVELAYLTRSITAVAGDFTITYTLNNTDIQFYNYNFIIYALADQSKCTLVLRRYLFIPNSAGNIVMTGNNIKSITTLDISSESKSVILPPITNLGGRGAILHFKVTDRTPPYIVQIMPYFSGGVPAVYTLYETLPTFDSTIDFNSDPDPAVTSPIFKLDTTNSVISLISNGSSDWKFLNYYTDSLSIAVQNSATPLPESRVEITSQNVILYYTDSIETICIFPSIESYYLIRYLTILNSTGSTKTYTIYFSQYESVDGVSSSGTGWCYTSLSVSATSIQSILFVRTPSGYLILGTTSYPGVTVSSAARGETAYPLLSKNITFSPAVVGQRDCEVPAEPTLTTGTSKLCILKSRRNSATTTTTNIYTPVNDASSKIIFDGNNNTSITFDQTYSSALWLSVFYTNTTNILPINFYTGTGPTFFTYLDVSGTTPPGEGE